MTYDLIDEEVVTEPVTLAEAKAYLQTDADYATTDDVIELAISTARIRLEQYLNVGLVNRDVKLQWNGRLIKLPLYPNGDIEGILLNDETDPLDPDLYTSSRGREKELVINSKICYGGSGSWFYSIIGQYAEFTPSQAYESIDTDLYTVTYNTGYDTLPLGLKQSLLAEMSYIFNLHGAPVTDLISPNAKSLSHGYSHNLVL